MKLKLSLITVCLFFALSSFAQRYITPTSDLIIDANFISRTLVQDYVSPQINNNGNLPGIYVSLHKNAPFGRTYLQANYNTGDLEGDGTTVLNQNVDQINVSLGYAHHIAEYYPACKIMNPFILGLIVKADMMNAEETVSETEVYANAYSVDFLFGHDLNFNSQNRLEITFFTPLISYYSVGTIGPADTEIENMDKYIGSGETSLLFSGRKSFGANLVYHVYFTDSFGINARYQFEKDDYENPLKTNTTDHQISAGIVLHFDHGFR